ncbi:type II secretion system protein [Pelomonas sp. BJYL3]|uniref:type II secretion system protein n=1 Tax=Pelomonas sp. BJYL3 TaxID=2976697 RepID=UPI0022B47037|nr:prepilin-type N-terminal cleavage/methylation domain-containing protein [Pelomonas sp. BJYL3]
MKPLRTRRRDRGLSLLEVMVTVAIFAMLFGVLMAGWHQSMKAQTQLSSAADAIQRRQHLNTLLRQVVAEAINPGYQSGLKFMGSNTGFAMESTTSLLPSIGNAPVDMELKLVTGPEGARLNVTHQGQAGAAFDWVFDRFDVRYVDHAGALHEAWPPARRSDRPVSTTTDTEQLPALLVFAYRLRGESTEQLLLAAPRNSAWELAEPSTPLTGMGLQ